MTDVERCPFCQQPDPCSCDAGSYDQRVRSYEAQGMTRSDAQGCVDAEIMKEEGKS